MLSVGFGERCDFDNLYQFVKLFMEYFNVFLSNSVYIEQHASVSQ